MSKLARDAQNHAIQALRPNKLQSKPVTVANAIMDLPVDGGSSMCVIGSTCDCLLALGTEADPPDAVAAPTGFLFAGAMVYIRVEPGKDKIAFVKMAGQSDGTAYCMEDTTT